MRLAMGYPNVADEKTILTNLQREHPITHLKQVVESSTLLALQPQVWEVHVDETLRDYIVRLVEATRLHPDLALGGSPRASLALFKAAQGLAALRGRDHVIPDDIKYLIPMTLSHRLIVKPESELRGRTVHTILDDILRSTALDIGSLP
jgi:MoxR-like ATPase